MPSWSDMLGFVKRLWAWVSAIAVASAPAIAASLSNDLDEWIPVYLAGGFGGWVTEMLMTRSQLEWPSYTDGSPNTTDVPEEEAEFASPTGPRTDLGCFGRFFVGGLAAVVFISLAAALQNESVKVGDGNLGSESTIFWAIAIGSAAPAVWRAIRRIVDAKVGAVRREFIGELKSKEKELEQEKKAKRVALQKAKDVNQKRKQRNEEARLGVIADGRGRAVLVEREDLKNRLAQALLAEPAGRSEDDATRFASQEVANLVSNADVTILHPPTVDDEGLDGVIGVLEALD